MLKLALLIFSSIACKADEFEIIFRFYSDSAYDPIDLNQYNVKSLNIDNTRQVKVLFHGYNSNSTRNEYYDKIIQGYLPRQHYVIALDYGPVVSNILYFPIVPLVPQVGYQISKFLIQFQEQYGFEMGMFHFIGHSMGAHIAAYTAQFIQNLTSYQRVGRISGLDPAGPGYLGLPPDQRLSFDDADFVDVIHTNGETFGYYPPLGHADFYPNGGKVQPDCNNFFDLNGCSHGRSALYFAESIYTNHYLAVNCYNYVLFQMGFCNGSSVVHMGEYLEKSAAGIYFLDANYN